MTGKILPILWDRNNRGPYVLLVILNTFPIVPVLIYQTETSKAPPESGNITCRKLRKNRI